MNSSDFIRLFSMRAPNMMWLFGAGTSVTAGIPSATDLIQRFKLMRFCSDQHIDIKTCTDINSSHVQSRINSYLESTRLIPSAGEDDYSYYFELTFPHEADRKRYLDTQLSGASVSFGHIAVACLLRMQLIRIIWTTNFDRLIEDAAAKVYNTTASLSVVALDFPGNLTQLVNDERFPILTKLHGDFHSRRLKNTTEELRTQDRQYREGLIRLSQRFGLSVVGYSGRDSSIMDTLEQCLNIPNAFPMGLFWFVRKSAPVNARVASLIETARAKGVEAEIICIETFDELFSDILNFQQDIPGDVRAILTSKKKRIKQNAFARSAHPTWPVLRFNALPMLSTPVTCRKLQCNIGGQKDVNDAIEKAATSIIAVRRNIGVLAFGSDGEIRKTFDEYSITNFDIHNFDNNRFRFDSAELGLVYRALVRAFERELPLKARRLHNTWIYHLNDVTGATVSSKSLIEIVGPIAGEIPGTSNLRWVEAVQTKLEFRFDQLWLVFLPTIYFMDRPQGKDRFIAAEFSRKRQATRYNRDWQNLIDAWMRIFTGNCKEREIRAFGIADGCDAGFTIGHATAFCYREGTQ